MESKCMEISPPAVTRTTELPGMNPGSVTVRLLRCRRAPCGLGHIHSFDGATPTPRPSLGVSKCRGGLASRASPRGNGGRRRRSVGAERLSVPGASCRASRRSLQFPSGRLSRSWSPGRALRRTCVRRRDDVPCGTSGRRVRVAPTRWNRFAPGRELVVLHPATNGSHLRADDACASHPAQPPRTRMGSAILRRQRVLP